ncbi:hypothetical protein [Sideroxydans sp. CL21]|uniref:hypothetical protein n=1 Tax=Sideroxydans sp. CL21 TaxID=2600596 RepID=UPI0024BCD6F6|nr:hypothetical protein [Sideroxydans sp. CL21]
MKKFLSIVGGIFLLSILVVGGFIGYAAYQGKDLDASSKAYIEANVPPIISSWSKDELLKRSSPQLLKIVNEKPEQLDQLFLMLSKLGALRSFGDVKGDSNVSYTTQHGKAVTASYSATAKYENGEAQISIRLIQLAGQWQFLYFYVNSPLFLK